MPSRREKKLMQLIHVLWFEIRHPTGNLRALEWVIRQEGMGWALPESIDDGITDDDWITPDEIAHRLGYAVSTVYVWAHRYKLPQVKGRYRWGDIEHLRQRTGGQ